MSNHLSAAAVTATLRKTLQMALDAASPGISNALVSTLRPNSPATELPNPGVNIFLYQVTPSAPLRTADLPFRRADGSISGKPQSALELHYLISFTGDDARLEPQFLLGITTRAFHSQPVITRPMIEAMLADPSFDFMAGSDLQQAPELVRLSPMPLSLEELSKLWSVVFQTPYVLSQVYRASVVVIDGTEVAPAPLPVARTAVVVDASMGPVVDLLLSQAGPGEPVVENVPVRTGGVLVLVGRDLLDGVTQVQVGATLLEPELASASSTTLKVVLPPSVPAGVHAVSVVQRGKVPIAGQERRSNSLSFQLQPTITASFAGGEVVVGFTPSVGAGQRARLFLNQADASAGSFTVEIPPRSSPAASLTFPVPAVPAGDYLVRVQLDGAESRLTFDPSTGRYDAPRVSIP